MLRFCFQLVVAVVTAASFVSHAQDTNAPLSLFINASGNPFSANISVVPSLLPIYTNQPLLNFVMQPEVVIENNPSMTITKGTGWQANFYPVLLDIELSDSAAILTWTNAGYTLQSAPVPLGFYTNVSGAVSPYTNNITGPAQYFPLISD